MVCEVCRTPNREASAAAADLTLLANLHFGFQMRRLTCCTECQQLIQMWDEFSQQARKNLCIAHPAENIGFPSVLGEAARTQREGGPDSTTTSLPAPSAENPPETTDSDDDFSLSLSFQSSPEKIVPDPEQPDDLSSPQLDTEENLGLKILHVESLNTACTKCDLTFDDVMALETHNELGHNPSTGKFRGGFPCVHCGRSFGNKQGLSHHTTHVHKSAKLAALNNSVKSEPEPRSEQDSIEQSPAQQSPACGSSSKLFACTLCSSAFPDFDRLREHVFGDHKNVPLHCETCKTKFPCQSALDAHSCSGPPQKRHLPKEDPPSAKRVSQEGSFHCHQCSNTFRSQASLSQHMRCHRGSLEGRVECAYCLAFFPPTEIKRHIQEAHDGVNKNTKLPCEFCHLVFEDEATRHAHLQSEHLHPTLYNQPNKKRKKKKLPRTKAFKNSRPSKTLQMQHFPKPGHFPCRYCKKVFIKFRSIANHTPRCPLNPYRIGSNLSEPTESKSELTEPVSEPAVPSAQPKRVDQGPQRQKKSIQASFKTELEKCKQCSTSVSRGHMKKHMRLFHSKGSFEDSSYKHVCEVCKRRLPTKVGLKRHMLHHVKYNLTDPQ